MSPPEPSAPQSPLRTLLTYALLVIPPFAILLLILHAGRDLVPPRAIGGAWVIDGALPAATDGCPALAFGGFRVAQSGPEADLRFDDAARTALSVALADDRVTGTGGGGDRCGALVLDARVAGDTLTGTLRRAGCPACPAIPLHATRTPAVPR